VDDARAGGQRRARDVAGARAVHGERERLVLLGAVDLRVGGAVDDDPRRRVDQEGVRRGRVREVELGEVGLDDLVAAGLRLPTTRRPSIPAAPVTRSLTGSRSPSCRRP
jgi:hypothetical protein